MKKITLGIEGMSCSACSSAIERHLKKQEGVKEANVNLVMANATIEYDETLLDQKKLETFIKQAGYKSTGIYKLDGNSKTQVYRRVLFIIFSVLAVLLLYVAMGHMVGLPLPHFVDMHHSPVAYTIFTLALTLPFLVYGFDIFIKGVKTLFHKAPNMDTLVTLGVLSSFGYSLFACVMVFSGHHEYVESLYFDSCGIIIYFIKLGRFIDYSSKNKTKEAIKRLVQITPSSAVIKRGEELVKVSLDQIVKGDIVVCRAGEKIAVDGKVIEGNGYLDQSFITGESRPVKKIVGDDVVAGSIVMSGYLEYEAEKIGKESTISHIVNLVVEATNTKMPIAKTVDKVSGIFVPCIMLLALITFVLYLILGFSINTALISAVTVLVVACPCSLGLGTPMAIVISEGVCAKQGILVKKSESLEIANKVTTIVFDKTGTLTQGKLIISKLINFSEFSEEEVLRLAGSIELKSSHPISRAFSSKLEKLEIEPYEVTEFESLDGLGLRAKIEGKELLLGNSSLLEKYGIINDHEVEEKSLAIEGNSIVYVVIDGTISALIGVNDLPREGAEIVINKLTKLGKEVVMLTGDNEETAKTIAKRLGIERVVANVLPSEKAEFVKGFKEEGKIVAMCGDGINDSPALAVADVGISMHGGTDIAMDSSDIVLMQDDLDKIYDLMYVSKKTLKNIKQNLFWAFLYNVLMIPIAMGIFRPWGFVISPMLAGLAMVLSSVTVVLNATRLYFIKTGGDMVKIVKKYRVEGLHCNHCKARLENALKALKEVKSVKVSLEERTAEVVFKQETAFEVISEVVENLGYKIEEIN